MLKKIKGLFVVEEEDGKKAEAPKSQDSSPPSTKQSVGRTPNAQAQSGSSEPPRPGADVKPSERFINKLLEAIEANNEKGFDYLEFKQSMQSLGNVNMDDATRYQSALAMAKTMGATSTGLVQSAERYLSVLSNEEQKFKGAFDNQQKTRVQQREQKLQSHQKGITDREARIKELQDDIVKMKAELEELKSSANQANAKVSATKDGFYSAYHILVDQIKTDLAMIKQHGN